MRKHMPSVAQPQCGGCRPTDQTRASRPGVAAVEFAIILPLLITILLGATDFGRFSHSTIGIANAARCGAGTASMNPYSAKDAWTAKVTQAVKNELSQSTAFDDSKLIVTTTNIAESGGLRRVSVQVTYPFETIIQWPFLPSTFNLRHTVVMRGLR